MGISIQFVGIAVFAMASFNIIPENEPMIVMYSLLVIGIGVIIEVIHIVTTRKLKGVKLGPPQTVLAVIGMTILIFFAANYAFFLAM